jgi:hypothetical protein
VLGARPPSEASYAPFSALPAGANAVIPERSLSVRAGEGHGYRRRDLPGTGHPRAELDDEVVHREQLRLTGEPHFLEHGPDHLAEPLEGLG